MGSKAHMIIPDDIISEENVATTCTRKEMEFEDSRPLTEEDLLRTKAVLSRTRLSPSSMNDWLRSLLGPQNAMRQIVVQPRSAMKTFAWTKAEAERFQREWENQPSARCEIIYDPPWPSEPADADEVLEEMGL